MTTTPRVIRPFSSRRGSVSPELTNARAAAGVSFFVAGMLMSSWVSRIPVIKHHLGLNTAQLSVALLGIPVGLLIAMRIVPRLVAWRSSVFVLRAASLLAAASLTALGAMWGLPSLTGCLVVFGVASGGLEVTINVQGTAIERAYSRPIMSRLHALYSIGILLGALAGSTSIALGISTLGFFAVMAVGLAVAGLLATRWLLRASADAVVAGSTIDPPPRGNRRLSQQPQLLAAGVIAFSGLFAEGAVNDWAGVFLHQVRGASFSFAALSVAAFGIGMALGRLGGDAIIRRWGRAVTLVVASGLSAFALAGAALVPTSTAAVVAFAALGLVLATVVPSAFSLGGAIAGLTPAWAISRLTTTGYLGTFASPAVVGFLAQATGLKVAMLLPALMLLLVWPATWLAFGSSGPHDSR